MQRTSEDEFFIGYAPPMPPCLARFVGRVVLTMALGALLWSVVLVGWHSRLDGGSFAFGHPQQYTGRLVERPYPALIDTEGTARLLVAPGKLGADALVRGLDGRDVRLRGTPIQRGNRTMIEVIPASIERGLRPAVDKEWTTNTVRETTEMTGEIVDTKCFLGVMVPGSGTTHRACASLCLRGGIPPALYVRDRDARSALVLLTDSEGDHVTTPAAEAAGRAIRLQGTVRRNHGWQVLLTDPASWHLLVSKR